MIVRRYYYSSLAVLTGLLVVFLVAILSAQSRGLDITCGCFGKTENATVYSEIILRDLGLLAVAIFLIASALWMRRAQFRHSHD